MRRAGWVLGSLLVLMVAAVLLIEVGGRIGAERLAEQRVRADVDAGDVEVVIGSAWWRPTIIPALVSGDLDRISVRLRDADPAALPISELDYVLEDISADFSVSDQSIRVTSLGSGAVRILVDPSAIGESLGVRAVVEDGQLLIGSDRSPARLEVVDEELQITSDSDDPAALDQTIRIADSRILPCTPDVSIETDTVVLECQGDELPGLLGGTFGPGAGEEAPLAPTELEPPATLELDPSGDPASTTTVPGG